MRLSHVALDNIRVIEKAEFVPSEGINYFIGLNGSGKTSLLEGIHVLSNGSSFRTNKVPDLIRHGSNSLLSVADVADQATDTNYSIGIERSLDGSTRARVNHQDVKKLTDLSQRLPLLSLHPESHRLITAGPSIRRKTIDWGVFHVEQRFIAAWKIYKRTLDQRNAVLKQTSSRQAVKVWDDMLVESGMQVQQYRLAYLQALYPYVDNEINKLSWKCKIKLHFKRGWPDSESFQEAICNAGERDIKLKTTTVGPHRAELLINTEQDEARNQLSRGQQKILAYVFKIAQANHIYEAKNIKSIFLCDDLPSELDGEKRLLISEILLKAGYQVFATGVEYLEKEFKQLACSVFHVEHGKIT